MAIVYYCKIILVFTYCTFQAEKRAHHNALERKRRDHIKDSFSSLRDSVPSLQGEKVVRICINFLIFINWLNVVKVSVFTQRFCIWFVCVYNVCSASNLKCLVQF